MTMTFGKAPLVEVVAELRWGDMAPPPVPGVPTLITSNPDAETFFIRLGGELFQHGYRQVERVVPSGFPVLPFQPVYRYRGDPETGLSVSFQAGHGLFVVNAVPPYRSWEEVEPLVSKGVQALLKARATPEVHTPFNMVRLRYINAFGTDLTEGRDVGAFLNQVLGFDIKYPTSLMKYVRDGARIEPLLQLSVPLVGDSTLAVAVAQALFNNEPKLLVDFTVTSGAAIAGREHVVMGSFRNARNVIHDLFVNWTIPIRGLLQPLGSD